MIKRMSENQTSFLFLIDGSQSNDMQKSSDNITNESKGLINIKINSISICDNKHINQLY